jgi:hypothetical protein
MSPFGSVASSRAPPTFATTFALKPDAKVSRESAGGGFVAELVGEDFGFGVDVGSGVEDGSGVDDAAEVGVAVPNGVGVAVPPGKGVGVSLATGPGPPDEDPPPPEQAAISGNVSSARISARFDRINMPCPSLVDPLRN